MQSVCACEHEYLCIETTTLLPTGRLITSATQLWSHVVVEKFTYPLTDISVSQEVLGTVTLLADQDMYGQRMICMTRSQLVVQSCRADSVLAKVMSFDACSHVAFRKSLPEPGQRMGVQTREEGQEKGRRRRGEIRRWRGRGQNKGKGKEQQKGRKWRGKVGIKR